jgi:hypothetical protein
LLLRFGSRLRLRLGMNLLRLRLRTSLRLRLRTSLRRRFGSRLRLRLGMNLLRLRLRMNLLRLRLRMNLLLGLGSSLWLHLGLRRPALRLCGMRLRLNRTRLRLGGAVLGLHRSGLRLARVDFRLAGSGWLNLRLAGTCLRLAGPHWLNLLLWLRLARTVTGLGAWVRALDAGLRSDRTCSDRHSGTALVLVEELLTVLRRLVLILELGRHRRSPGLTHGR